MNLKKLFWGFAFMLVVIVFVCIVIIWPSLLLGLTTIASLVFLFWLEGKIGATKVVVFACLMLVFLVFIGVTFFGPPPSFLSFIMSILVAFFRALVLTLFIVMGWTCWKRAFYPNIA